MDEGHEPGVKSDDFQKFLDAKGLEKPCALCNHNRWEVFVTGSKPTAPMTGFGLGTAIQDTFIRTYPMVCQNCGNTLLIASHVVREWVASHG